jgi:hypothetical protein
MVAPAMRDVAWDEMLEEFRALGGTAENICLREGTLGRGLFPIDPTKPIAIRIPDNLLIDIADAEFPNDRFAVSSRANIGVREKAFLERYENECSWVNGRNEVESVFEQAQKLSGDLRHSLTSEFYLGDWFSEPTDALIRRRFLESRCITYKGRSVLIPIVELANHGAGPPISTADGVAVGGLFANEVLVKYADFDACGMFVTWGFAADPPQAFSIALKGKVGERSVQIGRELGDLAPGQEFWTPSFTVAPEQWTLRFMMTGNRRHRRACREVFYRLMQQAGFSGFERAFETIQHANRLHFLKLLSLVENLDGALAVTLRRVARFQLVAMSYH